jgi:hypothetical protein
MCDQRDDRKNEQQVDQESRDVKEHEATYPQERQK